MDIKEKKECRLTKTVEEKHENIEIPQPKKIKVDYSEIHHRGIFATEDIESEELIERCPLVVLDFRTKYHKDMRLFEYLYTNKCPCKECDTHGPLMLLVMGYGMMYNHQDTPNTTWEFKIKDKVADVVANRPIKKGEEIFASYGASYFRGRKKITVGEENSSITTELPEEWNKWVLENLERGVPTDTIEEILKSNNFNNCILEEKNERKR
jgi:hypothetical protein